MPAGFADVGEKADPEDEDEDDGGDVDRPPSDRPGAFFRLAMMPPPPAKPDPAGTGGAARAGETPPNSGEAKEGRSDGAGWKGVAELELDEVLLLPAPFGTVLVGLGGGVAPGVLEAI